MKYPIIDAHIHLDLYSPKGQKQILQSVENEKIQAFITVSQHVSSAVDNLALAQENKNIFPAFGFHPEQKIPKMSELAQLYQLIDEHADDMIAVGEVGLPYYRIQEAPSMSLDPYIDILEQFIIKAKQLKKPIVLHAVYEHAPIVCDLLEKYSVQKAHFHWFKGDAETIQRMIENNYYISITPDILYKERTKQLVRHYPLSQIMVETDGPWPYEGPFFHKQTHPKMIHETMRKIAEIKKIKIHEVYEIIFNNTVEFYQLPDHIAFHL